MKMLTNHQINFIPADVMRRAYRRQLVPWAVVACMLTGGIVAGSAYLLDRIKEGLDQDIATRERVLTAASGAQQAEEKSALGTRLTGVTQRTSALNSLALTEIDWSVVFARAEQLIPKDITLTSYTAATKTTGVELKFSGGAPSNLSMAGFIGLLKENKELTRSAVESYSYSPATGLVQFTVVAEFPQSVALYKRNK